MTDYEKIESLKNGDEKDQKFLDYYTNVIKVNDWLNIPLQNSIINFSNRSEYKKNNKYHRLNGPAIEFKNNEKDLYYINGEKFDDLELWKKEATKILRRVKLKKLNHL